MRRHFPTSLLLLLALAAGAAAQDKPSVAVGEDRRELRIKIDTTRALPITEVRKLERIGTYELTEVTSPQDLQTMFAAEVRRIRALTTQADRDRALDDLAARLAAPAPNLVDAAATDFCKANCARVELPLTAPVEYGRTYRLSLAGVTLDGTNPVKPVEFKIEKAAEIQPALNASNMRREVRIQSSGPLAVTAISPASTASPLLVERKTLRVSDDRMSVVDNFDRIPAAASQPAGSPNLVEVKLDKRLNEAQSHTLLVRSGLTDGTGVALEAKGTVKIPGLPSPPADPELTLKIATAAAVAQKPLFDLTVAWAPVKKEGFELPWVGWWWQPGATIDVGLGNTKSNNSVVLASLFHFSSEPTSMPQLRPRRRGSQLIQPKDIQLKTYQRWLSENPLKPTSYDFFVGPKMEADRVFRRINALGNVRFNVRFRRWIATVKDKRELLRPELEDLADLVEINHGFRVVPYVSFDFGAHVKNETVENKKKNASLTVPEHRIFRSHVGLNALFQWRLFSFPMTLSVDESVVHLAATEQIGYVTDAGVALRRLRGFHHRGKASWDTALDPAKHYNFNVTYENGRLAPNFEYLNKLTTGFKVIF